jgi:DNA-binding NtrC family response regulator
LIVTSRQPIEEELAAGTIAPELWALVRWLSLSLPPLRARRGDIADLVDEMTAHWAARLGAARPSFHHGVLRVLVAYDWPGNIDQMSDLVARLVGYWSGKTIAIDQLPPDYFLPIADSLVTDGTFAAGDDSSLLRRAREHFERYFIRLILSRHHGDKREAASTLGMSYRTLCDKLRSDPDAWAEDV